MRAPLWGTLTIVAILSRATGSQPAVAQDPGAHRTPADMTPAYVRQSLDRAVTFLVKTQNDDGSWGGAWDSLTTWSGWTWSNPESHRSWRVATSALATLALLENADSEEEWTAVDQGVVYLCRNPVVKRPSEWDTMNSWAHIYGLQALAAAYDHPRYAEGSRRDDIAAAARVCLRQLAYHQSLSGGWGYLEFDRPRTARPQWATSFTTAAGIVALVAARDAGFEVDPGVLRRAVKAVRRCYLPNGAYTYSVRVIPHPRTIGSINRIKGSLSRIQSCNLALRLGGDDISEERLRGGLELFFDEHRFLDIARQKPIPHETYYQNSGYFYMFGHYYAALVIEQLPPEDRRIAWPRLLYETLKIQQADGAMWDYDHHAYDKPYGTAYGVMGIGRALRDAAFAGQAAESRPQADTGDAAPETP